MLFRSKGIINTEEYQIVLSDTPGIIKPAYKLHERMLNVVNETLTDADIVIYVTEIRDLKIEDDLKEKIKCLLVPFFVVINKVDESYQEKVEAAVAFWKEELNPMAIIPISALHNFNLDSLLNRIVEVLPEGPAYFDKDDDISDRNVRFFAAEMIREQILKL